MFGRTGQMFPRPRAYHDAIYEEEYGSETEEDCCRGRGISAIVCWLLSVIVLIGVAVAVVLTVFFVLRSRSPASTLEDLTTIFDNDLTFSSSIPTSVPAAAASDEVPPNSGSSSFEDDWGASTSSTSSSSSSTRSIFANSGHSSRKPTVYVDSSEIRQGGHRNNNNNHFKKTDIFVTHHQKPGFEAPSATTPVRESSSNTNGKVTTRRYYSDTTGQAVEDVISKTTSLPPSATTPERNSAQSNSDERVPSASESVEAIKKHSSQFFSEESSNSFQNHFPTTKPPSEAHGTTLFTAAPSSGPKTTNNNNNKRGRVKGNTKPFVLYPNNDTPNSSSEETFSASSSTTEAPAAESNSSEETPQAKKIPSGFRPSNFVDPTTLVTTSSPTTRVEDMLTRIIMRNKNTGTATTRRYSQPTTTPSTLESQEEPETTRRPGKMRTVVHRTTTTTQPSNVVLVTPSTDSNLIDRSSEEEPSQFATTVKTTTERPKLNDSSENIMDILVGSEDSKTLITKETDRGVITSAILPPWYQSDRDNESPEEITKPNKQRETSSKNDDHGLFRQPDLTALLDILSSSEGKPNLTSETYKNEMQTEASSKAERIKNIEDELKPVFVSGASETEREGMPVRHGSAATGFHFNGAGDTKTNIYGFFPDDLEGEESSEQLHVAPAPNHMVHPEIPTNKKDYDDADTSDGEDHVIDIAYDSKLNPEIQVEVEQSSEEEHHQHHHHNSPHGIMNGYGHREPLHSTEVDNPPPTSISHPDLEPPTAHQILPPFTSKAKPSKGNIEAPAPSVASAAAPTSQELPIAEISVEAHEDDGDFGTRSEERQPSGYGGNVQETRPIMKFHNEPQHHHHFGELPSASESTNVVQSPPSSEEERFDDTRKAHGDWSQKSSEQPPAPGKNFTQSHVPQNSLEEYSEEDPNYHYGTSLEEHLERLNTSTTTPPPTTTTTTSKPRTKIVEVYAQPYSPTHEAPTSTTPAPAYDDYYSNESPESNKTRGFVPPEPINFHDNQNNFASPEYTSKSGWRPLTFNHRKGSGQTHNSNTLMTPGGQGVRAPSTRPVELLQSPQRPRPPRPDLQPPTSSEEEQPQGPPKFLRPQHQQQQQDNTWTGIPSANVLPNTVQKLPTRMKFPSDSSPSSSNDEAPRPTIKVPQHQPPPQPLRHRTQMHIDRNKYLQRPAVPPIIMRRLPQIQQNPIQNLQNTRGPPETSAQPSSVPPPPPPHSSPPVVVTVPVSRRPIVQHRGPHQYLPPQRHQHNQGPPPPPPQQTSSPSGSIQWPSEDQHREHQQRQQSLLDQRIQQQQNIIRRNSQYLLNQRRHQG